jgi:hypothetical protein
VAQLAGLDEIVEHPERLRLVVDIRGRTVQLHQVEGLDPKVRQAALDEAGQVLPIVGGRHVRARAAAGLGGDVERLAALLAQSSQ